MTSNLPTQLGSYVMRAVSTPWHGATRRIGKSTLGVHSPILPIFLTLCPVWRKEFSSLFSADVLKKCALLALHVIAEEGRDGDGCHVPGLGDEWKMGCPKSPMWESEGEAWSEDETVSSSGSREGNVYNDALHVIGLYGPGGKISLFLQDWELAKVALSCHMAWICCARKCMRPGSWTAAAKRPFVTARNALLSPWTGCDVKGECGERK